MKNHVAKDIQESEVRALALKLMNHLRDNYHPHVTIIVTSEFFEVVEGLKGYPRSCLES